MSGKLTFFCIVFVLCYFISAREAASIGGKPDLRPVPSWVTARKPAIDFIKPDSISYGGYYYLLVDIQENIATETSFSHFAVKLFNNEGIQDLSDISVDFDPKYQTLHFHEINCYRDGQKINELLTHKIRTIQRETDMERFMYDGVLTSIVNLEDIREGDIIEYSYSLEGYNPTYKGSFCRKYLLDYSDPVKELYRKIVCPKEKPLRFLYPAGKAEPLVEEREGKVIYTWERNEIPAHTYDNNVPGWYNENLSVDISSYSDWSEVTDQALELFRVGDADLAKLKKSSEELFGSYKGDSVIVPAIRFVQDKIRYLGFESGLDGQKPVSPLKVLETRYADCKAKSLLLSEILNFHGIEAYPVLVNNNQVRSASQVLPSPYRFNHTIVQITDSGKVFYVDPTLANQGGSLGNIYIPDYGYGLVLRKGSDSLVRLVNKVRSYQKINNYFSMDSVGGPVKLRILTEYSGSYADDQREYFRENSTGEAVKSYLKFYSKLYPGIRLDDQLSYWDERDKNILNVEEHYIIDSLWSEVENTPGKLNLSVSPQVLKGAVSIPSSPGRTMPYLINYPADYTEDIYLNLPVDWEVKPTTAEITDSVFRFGYYSSYKDKQIRLHYEYTTFSDNRPARGFQAFYTRHEKIYDYLSYTLTYSKNNKKPFEFSWFALIAMLALAAVGSGAAMILYKKYDPPAQSTGDTPVGSWLVLVAIGLAFSTLATANTLFFNPGFFNRSTWEIYSEGPSQNPGMFIVMSIEFAYNILIIIYLILIQVLFYKRRTSLPVLIIILYAVSAGFLLTDNLIALVFSPSGSTDEQVLKAIGVVLRSIVVSAVWITYFIKSVRVKATFTKTFAGPASGAPMIFP